MIRRWFSSVISSGSSLMVFSVVLALLRVVHFLNGHEPAKWPGSSAKAISCGNRSLISLGSALLLFVDDTNDTIFVLASVIWASGSCTKFTHFATQTFPVPAKRNPLSRGTPAHLVPDTSVPPSSLLRLPRNREAVGLPIPSAREAPLGIAVLTWTNIFVWAWVGPVLLPVKIWQRSMCHTPQVAMSLVWISRRPQIRQFQGSVVQKGWRKQCSANLSPGSPVLLCIPFCHSWGKLRNYEYRIHIV